MMWDRRMTALSLYALTFAIAVTVYPMIIGEMRGELWKILLFALIALLAILFSALATLFAPLIALRAWSEEQEPPECREDGERDREGASPLYERRPPPDMP